jgi:hypothetical protein
MLGLGALECLWLTSDRVYWTTNLIWPELIVISAAPMVGVLGLGLVLLLYASPGRFGGRSFLTGFEVFGMAALFIYVACSRLFTSSIHKAAENLLSPYVTPQTPLFSLALVALFLVPQLMIALVGGLLTCRYQIRISIDVKRRRYDADGPMLASQGL